MVWIILGTLFAIFYALPLLLFVGRICTLKLYAGQYTVIEASDIPVSHKQTLMDAELFLQRNGFTLLQRYKRSKVISGQDWGVCSALYYHSATNTWALAYTEATANEIFEYQIRYLTPCEADAFIASVSSFDFDKDLIPPQYQLAESLRYDQAEQWEFHVSRIQGVETRDKHLSDAQIMDCFEELFFEHLIATKTLVKHNDYYRMPILKAATLFRNYRKNAQLLYKQKVAAQENDSGALSPETQLAYYENHTEIKRKNRLSGFMKTGFLLVSVVLFALAFGLSFSWSFMLILLAVLFVHELGHLFGMWLFGYKDLTMLFVPFLGALASGHKKKVVAWQEAIILLLGPLPGYVLGIYLLSHYGDDLSPWMHELAFIAIFLNLINLLPFLPLDGGRLVAMALFSRFPAMHFMFTLMSIAALLLSWFTLGEYVALAIAILLIVGLPLTYKEMRLMRYLLKDKTLRDSLTTKRLICTLNNNPLWTKQAVGVRWILVDNTYSRLSHMSSSVVGGIGIMVLWVSSIVLPPALLVSDDIKDRISVAALHLIGVSEYSKSVEQLEKDYQSEQDIERKIDIGFRIVMHYLYDDRTLSTEYWEALKAFLDTETQSPSDRATFLLRLSYFCSSFEEDCYDPYVTEAFELHFNSHTPLRDLYHPLSMINQSETLSVSDKLAYIDKYLLYGQTETSNEEPNIADTVILNEGHKLKAYLLEKRNDIQGAEREWRHILANTSPANLPYRTTMLTSFYLRHNEQAKAKELLKTTIDNGITRDDMGGLMTDLRYIYVWLTYQQNPQLAIELLSDITGENIVETIELALAKNIILAEMGNKALLIPVSETSVTSENKFHWAEFKYALDVKENNLEPDQTEAIDAISRDWYLKMASLLKQDEYREIQQILNDNEMDIYD